MYYSEVVFIKRHCKESEELNPDVVKVIPTKDVIQNIGEDESMNAQYSYEWKLKYAEIYHLTPKIWKN